MDPKNTFFSCDWGTSSFRLLLVERHTLTVLAQVSSREGNAAIDKSWQQAKQPPAQRLDFYLGVLQPHLQKLEVIMKMSLKGVPIVISGMASSTIGMAELPYKPLPFATDGTNLQTKYLPPTARFEQPILLISGVKSEDDVMRGEETQLVGCALENTPQLQLFLHPGTHTKHVQVQHGRAVSLTTYMTGEVFSLLSKESILAASVEEGGQLEEGNNQQWFAKGIQDSQQANLLHNAFLVRTQDLFRKATRQENYFYLSGLVIGSECQDLVRNLPARIVLAGKPVLVAHYSAALHVLGIADKVPVEVKNGEDVTIKGQWAVFQGSQMEKEDA
ncbi:2-dehydro-3-deoxygalactonokinase [Hymenobacter sp. DG25B]|uniref:2-dehydro-3-deoxygalactonokinase n=1 Tax=Hymenobacter sp. DG25B TaxID=1385664 RepID=UPI00081417DD|nr:2-dehydro-3-deoxygalactonokinase [Hymenobacter sp. DG25B]